MGMNGVGGSMNDGQSIPVEAVDDEGLRELGAAWTEALIEHAKRKRDEASR